MSLLIGTRRALLGGRVPYYRKVLKYNPIAYWPLWEPTGATAGELVNGWDGAYIGVTLGQPGIGDGSTAPFFDGANDLVNIYSAAFNAAFDPTLGTLAIWARAFNAGVWTDGNTRRATMLRATWQNEIAIQKAGGVNALGWVYAAAGTVESVFDSSLGGSLDWFHMTITWDKAGDAVKAFLNGSQVGATQAGLGIWAGALSITETLIGARNTGLAEPWHGYLAHCAVFDVSLTQPQIEDLTVV